MVTVLTITPLVLALFLTLGMTLHALKSRSLAQSVCVQNAIQLQTNLKRPLKKLLHMNQEARRLRLRRETADHNLQTARASGIPYVIAVAQAAQLAVIAQQVAFRFRQEAVLSEARVLRRMGQQNLYRHALTIGGEQISTPTYYYRALAVEPKPITSISPDFIPIPLFQYAQQQRFRFRLDLFKHWWLPGPKPRANQTTECSVTLKGAEQIWDINILAANAPRS